MNFGIKMKLATPAISVQQNLNSNSIYIRTIHECTVTTWQLTCCTALMRWATISQLPDFNVVIEFTWSLQGACLCSEQQNFNSKELQQRGSLAAFYIFSKWIFFS